MKVSMDPRFPVLSQITLYFYKYKSTYKNVQCEILGVFSVISTCEYFSIFVIETLYIMRILLELA
jgi:hypothetical protein